MDAGSSVLTLADLEQLDPSAPDRGSKERRFCCPLPACASKPIDAEHRSLCLNTETGAWRCHRCEAAGRLKEYWEERTPRRKEERARAKMRRRLEGEATRPDPVPGSNQEWRRELRGMVKLSGTPGESYLLEKRGIPLDLANAARVRFHPRWYYGGPALLFPMYDGEGHLVCCNGRYLDPKARPKTRTAGAAREGVFTVPHAWEADPLILVEGPCDALSLALAGFPAVALVAANKRPQWLPRRCAGRRVLVALDADPAGDAAAEKWLALLRSWGAPAERLRPAGGPPGTKDWNDLARDPEAFEAALAALGDRSDSREPSGPKHALFWDNERADALIRATYRHIGALLPGGALPWADEAALELAAALDAAEGLWEEAHAARDMPALVETLTVFEATAADLADAFAQREAAPELQL